MALTTITILVIDKNGDNEKNDKSLSCCHKNILCHFSISFDVFSTFFFFNYNDEIFFFSEGALSYVPEPRKNNAHQ